MNNKFCSIFFVLLACRWMFVYEKLQVPKCKSHFWPLITTVDVFGIFVFSLEFIHSTISYYSKKVVRLAEVIMRRHQFYNSLPSVTTRRWNHDICKNMKTIVIWNWSICYSRRWNFKSVFVLCETFSTPARESFAGYRYLPENCLLCIDVVKCVLFFFVCSLEDVGRSLSVN